MRDIEASYLCLELSAGRLRAARVALMPLGMPRVGPVRVALLPAGCSAAALLQQAEQLIAHGAPQEQNLPCSVVYATGSADPAAQLAAQLSEAAAPVSRAHAAALAEHSFGVGRGLESILWVYLGQRLVSCVADIQGIRYGASGSVANIAHLFCPAALGRTCSCGGQAHLATLANTAALCMLYTELQGPATRATTPSLVQLDERACRGEAAAVQTEQLVGSALGQALATAAQLVDPAAIVLAGPMSKLAGPLMPKLRESFSTYGDPRRLPTAILMAELGEQASFMGAALHYKLCLHAR